MTGLFRRILKEQKKKQEQEKMARLLYGGTQSSNPLNFVAYPGQAPMGYNKGGVVGEHRKMFRKPGLARQALGILASSGELMNEVQPRMQMAQAGAVNKSLFDQATQMVDGMIASGQAPVANREAAINNLYRYYENQALMNPRPAASRMQGYMDPASGPIDTTGVRDLPAAIANYQGEGIGSMIGPEKPDTVLVPGPTVSDIALDATAPVREAGRAVGRNVKQGLENLADTVSRDARSTADAIMSPNEAARRAVSEGATASQDGAIDTRGIRDLPIDAARAVRGDGIAVFDPNYKPPMAEAGEAVTEGMRNLKETVSRDTGSMFDSIRSIGARLAEPSDKEKEEQKIQDRLDQQTQLAEMLKAGSVKDDGKTPTGGLTGDNKAIVPPPVDGRNEDEDDPPKSATPTAKEADKNDKEAVGSALDQWKEVTGDDDDNNFWNALMIAGLGIAAGDSDDPVMNIAKGALAGIQQYNKDKKDDEQSKFMRFMKEQELGLQQQRADAATKQAEAAETGAEARLLAAQYSDDKSTDYTRKIAQIQGIQDSVKKGNEGDFDAYKKAYDDVVAFSGANKLDSMAQDDLFEKTGFPPLFTGDPESDRGQRELQKLKSRGFNAVRTQSGLMKF